MNPVLCIAEALGKRGNEVQVLTFAFGSDKFQKKVEIFGSFVGLPCAYTEQEILAKAGKDGVIPFNMQAELMKAPLRSALRTFKPDIIVTDFMTFAPMEVAEEMDVPLVINCPAPMETVRKMMRAPNMMDAWNFMGCFTSMTPMDQIVLAETFHLAGVEKCLPVFRKHSMRALVAINSFYGFEPVSLAPPFVAVTGPLALQATPGEFTTTHPELHAFLEQATRVVYVTTGSMVHLPDWLILVLFEALKKVGCSVVWSLKADKHSVLPDASHPAFHVSAWLPQPTLLAHPKVAAVITHCGWGGTLECIAAGKPVLTLPFFGDQIDNAKLLVKSGMGVHLGPLPNFNMDHSGASAYKAGSFSVASVALRIAQMLKNPKYGATAERMKALSQEAGGAAALSVRIENAARNGVEHLHNKRFERKVLQGKPTVFYAAPTLLVGVAAFLMFQCLSYN